MDWLLIDNSNSRTKFRIGNGAGLAEWSAMLPTRGIEPSSVSALLDGMEFSAVAIASVVPETERILRGCFEHHDCHSVTHLSPLGYGFEVDAPEQIGHDRLANVAALKQRYGQPAIAVDFGTAVTFSVLSSVGNFAGGVIAPGMSCMTEYLAQKTAQLPQVSPVNYVSAIGKTTVEALQIGAVAGHRGMVREILHEITAEIGGKVTVIATGGGASAAAQELPEISLTDPDLTLEGIRLVAARVFGAG